MLCQHLNIFKEDKMIIYLYVQQFDKKINKNIKTKSERKLNAIFGGLCDLELKYADKKVLVNIQSNQSNSSLYL